ncbi:hypothetical protein CMV30_12970 [Nibricoccus aquaticus]|uniref:Schlafen AlbA-2 domain-containing protein n=1 Tax=Nibricoccus aquaticus TaxID=2576891 RepID=A0A290Q8G6_9BACT|nr:ATP-binding protein [Nibricoccus aquaticus]ATC64804.1 hypothetical protein CMV30_12970 [Nibricoccus aquaticus]
MKAPPQFVLGEALKCEETRHVEFKEVKGPNPFGSISNAADEYAVAFLNSEGGRIYWGIRNTDRVVVGVELSASERERLREVVVGKLSEIQPQLDPGRFKLTLHPVINGEVNSTVVELEVPAGNSSKPFYTGGHGCFVRLDGVKKKLSGQQLTDWILSRVEKNTATTSGAVTEPQLLALAQRVRRILSGHGLQPGHLARFFSARKAPFTITFADQQNDAVFLRWLDESKTAWVAQTFGVRREWIDGEDSQIFDWCDYDKRPALFLKEISQYVDSLIYDEIPASPEALFVRYGSGKDWKRKGQNRVFVIVRVPLARLSNETIIFRYVSDFMPYYWDEGRTAVQLRAWARLLFITKNISCQGCEVPLEIAEKMEDNQLFLHEIFESPKLHRRCHDWHPEDYALYPQESRVAQPDAFFEHMIAFLKTHNLPHEPTRLQ